VKELEAMRDEASKAGVEVLMGYNKNVCKVCLCHICICMYIYTYICIYKEIGRCIDYESHHYYYHIYYHHHHNSTLPKQENSQKQYLDHTLHLYPTMLTKIHPSHSVNASNVMQKEC